MCGWDEVVTTLSAEWKHHAVFGVHNPDDNDSLHGRLKNQFLFANLIWHMTERLSSGWEVS